MTMKQLELFPFTLVVQAMGNITETAMSKNAKCVFMAL